MTRLVGYSDPSDGYCVHDETGTTWGKHPGNYEGHLLFLEDKNGMVTAVGREATDKQREALQEDTLPWQGEIPYGEAIVTGDDAMDAIIMMNEGP